MGDLQSTKDLLKAIGTTCGFTVLRDAHPHDDPRLPIGADWHVGIIFQKGQMPEDIPYNHNFYRRILDET